MDIRDIRDIMGLSQAQVADELGVPKQEVIDCEENGETYLLLQYISAFPVNPQVLKDPDVDPFLPSFDQGTPGDRLRSWREEHGISPEDLAAAIEISPEDLARFEAGEGNQLTRRRGEEIERKTGINRKWLMYGDGRTKGAPRLKVVEKAVCRPGRQTSDARIPAPNKPAGLRVKQARIAAGLSREQLADLLDLSVSRIAQMESGYIKDQKADQILSRIAAASGTIREESPKEAGIRLRNARKEAGLTVKEAAEIIGLKHTTLAHLESGYITSRHADELIEQLQSAPRKDVAVSGFNPKETGLLLREERNKAGLSQKELATILHVPVTRISHIELGNVTEPEAERILRRIHGQPVREINTRKVKPTDQVILGSNIRDARIQAGLSQKALGDQLNLPQTKISLIERGKVDEATAKKILQMLSAVMENRKIESDTPAVESVVSASASSRPRVKKPLRPELGRQLQDARRAAGLSQKAVADLLGLSQGSVSYMEQGKIDEASLSRVLQLIEDSSEKA